MVIELLHLASSSASRSPERDRADARTLLSDGRFHPSDAGHAAFAGVLAPLVPRAAGR
jgi:hypothetical protein